MQRQEFLQQLWLDYVHQHPELASLRLWPLEIPAEYLALLTLNHGPFAADALIPALKQFGYQPVDHYAMADRGLLVTLLSAPDDGAWLALAELQLGTLTRHPRAYLENLVKRASNTHTEATELLIQGRPWPMPDWEGFEQLQRAHPLAGWLALMGPRLHHAGYDCERLGSDLPSLDRQLQLVGLKGNADRHHGIFPVSPLLNYRFYPTCSQRLAFAHGDEHRLSLGGLVLVQKCLLGSQERAAELLLPQHTRCEIVG